MIQRPNSKIARQYIDLDYCVWYSSHMRFFRGSYLKQQLYVYLHWHVFDDLHGYSSIYSILELQVVHLKRGYGNLPAYGEMNRWQHCICMRFA